MIKIYKSISAGAIFIEDDNGAQFLSSIQALDSGGSKVSIVDLVKKIYLVYEEEYTEFVNEHGIIYGNSTTEVVNTLNSIFQSSGTSTTDLPIITSTSTVNIVEGESLNYELTATNGVGYEWLNLPSGITTVEGNTRKIIGGSQLAVGTYVITMVAINYNGQDSETLTLTVDNPPYSNSKSTKFVRNDYLTGTIGTIPTTLGRVGNGSGVTDAWTISLWFKPGTHTGGAKQTIFYYGDSDHDNAGHIWIYYKGSEKSVYLEYGSKNNYLRFRSPTNSLTLGTWSHLKFTYDGGTTGSNSGSINDYYSRFSTTIDNILVPTINTNGNFGWANAIGSDILQVGKRADGNDWLKNDCKIDELSSFNIVSGEDLYNSGVPFDMSTLTTPPTNGWRFGDGDIYPTILDVFGTSHFTMLNMTSADFTSDVP